MKVITFGRSSENDVVVHDSTVSRHHLQIIQDDNGGFRLADFGSKNGTYVNNRKVSGEIPLHSSDIVRIGNTTLKWRKYFTSPTPVPPPPVPDPTPWPGPSGGDSLGSSSNESDTKTLSVIALLLSLAAAVFLIMAIVLAWKWVGTLGFFGLLGVVYGSASTYVFIALGLSILADILAYAFCDNSDESDAALSIAEWISNFCISLIVGAFIYWLIVTHI